MTTESKILPLKDFKLVVQKSPLFAIDLVIVNEHDQILVGERLNSPAKGMWFVPGGRVYKNETLEIAFKRISRVELGLKFDRDQAFLLGLYEHFYKESFFDKNISTHYINATHVIRLSRQKLDLPLGQHGRYRWITIKNTHGLDLIKDKTVHKFSKVFLPALEGWLEQEST